MTIYYIQDNDKIVFADEDLQKLQNTLAFTPQYAEFEILQTENLIINGIMYTQEEWDAKEEQEKAERLAELKLTKREVFLALYNDSGITPEEIKAGITDESTMIEFEYANDYYRGNPLIDMIGSSLGYSKEQLDYLFEHKQFPPKDDESLVKEV